jgi:hypothetical protein
VHDYFEILGVPRDARGVAIRRASARRASRVPPDFLEGGHVAGAAPPRPGALLPSLVDLQDVAIDFVDMTSIVDRMRAAFFGADR